MPGNLSVIYRPLLEIQEAEATELLNRLQFRTDLFEHGLRVANFAVEIAREIDLSSQTQEEIRIASIFHDTGKLFIPNAILHKKFLTSQEWKIILTHSQLGKEILETSAYLRQFGPWVSFILSPLSYHLLAFRTSVLVWLKEFFVQVVSGIIHTVQMARFLL